MSSTFPDRFIGPSWRPAQPQTKPGAPAQAVPTPGVAKPVTPPVQARTSLPPLHLEAARLRGAGAPLVGRALPPPGAVPAGVPAAKSAALRMTADAKLVKGLHVSEGKVFRTLPEAVRHEVAAVEQHNRALPPGSPDKRQVDLARLERRYIQTTDARLFTEREAALAHQITLLSL